jgi:hypothetical protein
MRSSPPAFLALLLALCVFSASPAGAQLTGIDDLCRLHGIGDDKHRQDPQAYLQAMETGISEEILFPFVEDVLRTSSIAARWCACST